VAFWFLVFNFFNFCDVAFALTGVVQSGRGHFQFRFQANPFHSFIRFLFASLISHHWNLLNFLFVGTRFFAFSLLSEALWTLCDDEIWWKRGVRVLPFFLARITPTRTFIEILLFHFTSLTVLYPILSPW